MFRCLKYTLSHVAQVQYCTSPPVGYGYNVVLADPCGMGTIQPWLTCAHGYNHSFGQCWVAHVDWAIVNVRYGHNSLKHIG